MIFDNDKITDLTEQWKKTHSRKILDEIIKESEPLIGVIISRFDSSYREELNQECKTIIIERLDRFDKNRGRLHAWLTSVLMNHCIIYVTRSARTLNLDDMEITVTEEDKPPTELPNSIGEVVARNRKRFSSLPCTMIDEITRYICLSAMFTVYGKSRGVIRYITNKHKISRTVATVIYHSTVLYMRQLYLECCNFDKVTEPEELSLLYDMKDLLGEDLYKKISTLFSGTYVKFP